MKKFALLLSVILIFCLCACDKPNPYFKATVIENRGTILLVAPNEDEKLYSVADRIYITTPEDTDSADYKTGDKVKIVYTGDVAESYPAHIASVVSIEHITE